MWQRVLDQLAARLDRNVYQTWIGDTQLLLINDDDAFLGTPNVFIRDVVERDYRLEVEAALRQVSGRSLTLNVVIGV
ncbi:MAG TPA: DnaA N-terminal domain-containing protein [Herpetosiphonaceae bacterium]|nr:DnaA N-terminal domain-containing protein [Herpetosiphonaceae bacterium]